MKKYRSCTLLTVVFALAVAAVGCRMPGGSPNTTVTSAADSGSGGGSLALITLSGTSSSGTGHVTVVDMTTFATKLPLYEGHSDVKLDIQNGVSPAELASLATPLSTFNTDFTLSFRSVDSQGLINAIPAGCFGSITHLKKVQYCSDRQINIPAGSVPSGTIVEVYARNSDTVLSTSTM